MVILPVLGPIFTPKSTEDINQPESPSWLRMYHYPACLRPSCLCFMMVSTALTEPSVEVAPQSMMPLPWSSGSQWESPAKAVSSTALNTTSASSSTALADSRFRGHIDVEWGPPHLGLVVKSQPGQSTWRWDRNFGSSSVGSGASELP